MSKNKELELNRRSRVGQGGGKNYLFDCIHGSLFDLESHGAESVCTSGCKMIPETCSVELVDVCLDDFFGSQSGKQSDEKGNEPFGD